MTLQMYGIFDSHFSLGSVSANMARALRAEFPNLLLYSYLEPSEWDEVLQRGGARTEAGWFLDEALAACAGRRADADVGVFVGVATAAWPLLKCHRTRIAFLVCETTAIPSAWIPDFNRLDLIVVPSTFCRRAFVESGVRAPIVVLPHALDPEYRPYPDVVRRSDVFEFFNTFGSFAPPERKGFVELVRCFSRVFAGDATTRLVVRTHPTAEVADVIRAQGGNADVRLEPLRYEPIEVYARRMASAHCVVHPSKGEGFGMTPFQAIACETPVIAPAASGMADYLTPENATLLRTAGFVRAISWDEKPGWYFAIDEDHLEECLRNVRSDWPNKLAQLRAVAPAFRRRYAPGAVLRPLADFIRRLRCGAAFDEALEVLKGAESS